MRNRLAILATAAVLPLTGVTSLAAAGPAAADPNKATVTVTGRVADCENDASPVSVTITTSKEAQTDDSGTVTSNNRYSVTFKNIARKGRDAVATVTCKDDSYTDNFRIMRPADTSTTFTRNLEP
ncbi:hypothetical protein ACFY9A_12710 [Streptomyces rubradiris]|uniref:hypothetical protein n=1 Tax=Streptomyces rubradiris TaxID=285531 RepID=UPI00340235D7